MHEQINQQMATLRIMTAGSVDDGKSTLIGRLMHDLDLITDDVMQDLKAASKRNGRGALDLSLYTDGLAAEREQGITIDVAYRYFRYKDRSYVLCDAPGHVQYTRNMVCAASQSDVALVMIDARSGPTEQTRRHVRVAQMLQVSKLVFVVNKLDLIGFDKPRYDLICEELKTLAKADIVPVCALDGDNIVRASATIGENRITWYGGPTLIELLAKSDANSRFPANAPLRFSVQSVMRPTGNNTSTEQLHDYRAFAGRVESGTLAVGQIVQINSASGDHIAQTTVSAIYASGKELPIATAGQSISITLKDDVGVSRGDMMAAAEVPIDSSNDLIAQWCWMHEKPAVIGQKLLIKQGTRTVQAKIISIDSKLNLDSGLFIPSITTNAVTLAANEIARIRMQLAQPLLVDSYSLMPRTGSLIAIDPQKLDTLGAAVID
jgi:sulfate adenylyltransferase subunit 1